MVLYSISHYEFRPCFSSIILSSEQRMAELSLLLQLKMLIILGFFGGGEFFFKGRLYVNRS